MNDEIYAQSQTSSHGYSNQPIDLEMNDNPSRVC